jgi:hypothetical protein
MAEKAVRRPEQLAAHAGIGDERSHEKEHRDDAEGVIGHRAHGCVTDDLEGSIPVDEIGKARDTDQSHRHAHRHAQQHQCEQRDEADDGDRIRAHRHAHSTGLIWYCPPINSGRKISR